MAFVLDDRTQETAVIGGLGNYVLTGAAVPGFQAFASVMSIGDTSWVYCYDPTSKLWEVDLVAFASGNQLQRSNVLASSAGGAKINFPGNTCQISMTIPAAFVLETLAQSPSGSPMSFGTISWGAGSVGQDGTITITLDQPQSAVLTQAIYENGPGGGTIDAAVIVNGSTAADFGAMTVDGTGEVVGSASVPSGAKFKMVTTNASGTVDGAITLNGTWA